ncbi:hypothetical protein THAOC_28316 [Thalassiosira oceanica]|uniref:Uncharacterized protein n=1 Tax=Thalassiosira oceanica TaxID=159749 RepID=K0RGM2_THAOC|nr:hypothetical protein THAOC_28316 [Thalassiosira oceanica]|eukprot:EJK52410.1 hypothetical protein THAOC_28316 [Thalassiosira oceanica]
MSGALRLFLTSPLPIHGMELLSSPEHKLTPRTSIQPSITPNLKPSVFIIASCKTLCIPKKKKTHSANVINWNDLGRDSNLLDRSDPRLPPRLLSSDPALLPASALLFFPLMNVLARDLEGVVGQSSNFDWSMALQRRNTSRRVLRGQEGSLLVPVVLDVLTCLILSILDSTAMPSHYCLIATFSISGSKEFHRSSSGRRTVQLISHLVPRKVPVELTLRLASSIWCADGVYPARPSALYTPTGPLAIGSPLNCSNAVAENVSSQIGQWNILDDLHPEDVPLPDLRTFNFWRRRWRPKVKHFSLGRSRSLYYLASTRGSPWVTQEKFILRFDLSSQSQSNTTINDTSTVVFLSAQMLAHPSHKPFFLSRPRSLLPAADVAENQILPNRADDPPGERDCPEGLSARFGDMSGPLLRRQGRG